MHTFMAALLTGKAGKKAREDSYKKLISLAFRCVLAKQRFSAWDNRGHAGGGVFFFYQKDKLLLSKSRK